MTFVPVVRGATTPLSSNISTVMTHLHDGSWLVPDFQRDSDEWKLEKRSLFIESIINNLTVPPLIVAPSDDESGLQKMQVVDGAWAKFC